MVPSADGPALSPDDQSAAATSALAVVILTPPVHTPVTGQSSLPALQKGTLGILDMTHPSQASDDAIQPSDVTSLPDCEDQLAAELPDEETREEACEAVSKDAHLVGFIRNTRFPWQSATCSRLRFGSRRFSGSRDEV